jgi:cation diffusion facilitator CzcD-associated flavoprotein CzcO
MSVPSIAPRRHRVVIIGSGFGGLFAAKHLKRADVDITLREADPPSVPAAPLSGGTGSL